MNIECEFRNFVGSIIKTTSFRDNVSETLKSRKILIVCAARLLDVVLRKAKCY